MIARAACIGLALLSIFAAPLQAAPVQPLPALSPWDLDYSETQCTAMRGYGAPEGSLTLAIIPAPNGRTYELLIARKRNGPRYAEELEGSVDFGSGPIKAWLLHYSSEDQKVDLYQYRITAAEMLRARSASAVTLHLKGGADAAFALDAMPALLDGLQECTDDLKEYWGIEKAGPAIAPTPPKGDVRTIFTANDYPAEAIHRSQQGTAQFLLLINEKGSVAACHVLEPSGIPVLDAMGCVVLQERAKFKPALDAAGKPVRSSTVTPPVTWRIGG